MMYDVFYKINPTEFSIGAVSPEGIKAARLFSEEIKERTGYLPSVRSGAEENCSVIFIIDPTIESKDYFIITFENDTYVFKAQTIRGLIFAYSLFYVNGQSTLVFCL